MSRLELFVRGVPVPQGSKRIGRHGSRPVILDANDEKLAPWREHMTATARIAMVQTGFRTLTGPVHVSARFVIRRPQGHWGTGRNGAALKPSAPKYPAVRPDVDKYLRAALDALTVAAVFKDDGQVIAVEVAKVYGTNPGVELIVTGDH